MTVNTKPSRLMRSLRPIMFLSQIMGVTFHPKAQSQRFRLVLLYRVIVLAILTLCLLREIPSVMFWSRNLKGVHGMLAYIETRLRWIILIFNFLLTSFNNNNINHAVGYLINCPLILKKSGYNSILGTQCFLIVMAVFMISCYMSLGHDFLWLNPYYEWFTSTIYISTEFYIGFSNLQFVVFIFAIKKYFKALNENLSKCDFKPSNTKGNENFVFLIAKGCKRDNVSEIVKFRQIHMNLTTACWKTNQCFSLQILMFLLISLVEITYSLRSVTIYTIKDNPTDVNRLEKTPVLELALIFFWGGYYIWTILMLIVICENTSYESSKTTAVVHELLNKVEDKEIEKQLQLFSLQLMNHRVVFSAGKFVILHYPLLNSIIGTIITYLVIIITFSG